MRFATAAFMTGLLTVVSAHFQLQYPPPRGEFVEKNEVNFCDGYADSISNRSTFPTSGGFISINAEHPKWTLGGIAAITANANSFDTFKDGSGNFQQVVPFFQTSSEGVFCMDVNLAASGVSGIKDGANVTIQLIFDGGDGQLYQCADLTLSDSFEIPSDVSCKNATNNVVATPVSTGVSTPSSTSPSGSGSTTSPTATNNAALRNVAIGTSGVAGLFAAVIAML
ncbi:hypothetical protein C8Q80DRAFT_1132549 [Daedaleopsis nitida]|nr:hypothetical protein C8Q80DRAFT_1132549 [Daedaleopsis nitida]